MSALSLPPVAIIPTAPPLPARHEWIGFMRLHRFGWEKYEQDACVLAHSADESRLMVGFINPDTRRPMVSWIDAAAVVRTHKRVTDADFLSASV